jgi:hypothetical protein
MLPPSRRGFKSIKFLFARLNGRILDDHEENQRIGNQQLLKVRIRAAHPAQ